MSAISKGHIEGPRNVLVRCASFLIGSVGFGLSVLAALLHLLYSRPPVPDIAEQKSSPSTRSPRKREKQLSVSSSNASTLVPTTPINSNSKFQPSSPDASSQEKLILQEQMVLVTEPKDDLDTPTTLVDSPGTISSEESHTDDFSRKKGCSCRVKDPSRKCNGKCLFRGLRKTPSAPSSLSPTSCVSHSHKKKSQPRLRTMPYDAPFFLPTPDSLPPRPTPSRSQTSLPPLRPKVTRSQSVFLEKPASSETETPRSPKHVTVLLPPATARHS